MYAKDNGTTVGGACVYSGADGGQIHSFLGESSGGKFGFRVCGAGDMNQDGFADVIVSAPYHHNSTVGKDTGAVFVYSGAIWMFEQLADLRVDDGVLAEMRDLGLF